MLGLSDQHLKPIIMESNTNLLKRVQEELAKESRLKNCLADIYILVNDSAVILAGSVRSESLKKLARKIVSEIPGVNLLIEDLKVETHKQQRVGVQIDWAKGSMALSH